MDKAPLVESIEDARLKAAGEVLVALADGVSSAARAMRRAVATADDAAKARHDAAAREAAARASEAITQLEHLLATAAEKTGGKSAGMGESVTGGGDGGGDDGAGDGGDGRGVEAAVRQYVAALLQERVANMGYLAMKQGGNANATLPEVLAWQQAGDRFNDELEKVSELETAVGARLPWQLKQVFEPQQPLDEGTVAAKPVVQYNIDITDKEGRGVATQYCSGCGKEIQVGMQFGSGVKRKLCLDCPFSAYCMSCFERDERVFHLLQSHEEVNASTAGGKGALQLLAQWNPHLVEQHFVVVETESPMSARFDYVPNFADVEASGVAGRDVLTRVVLGACRCFAARRSLGSVHGGSVEWITYADVERNAVNFGAWLDRNVGYGAVVCVCSQNRYEYMLADLGCTVSTHKCVIAGLPTSWSEEVFRHALGSSKAKVVVCSAQFIDMFRKLCDQGLCDHVLCFDDTGGRDDSILTFRYALEVGASEESATARQRIRAQLPALEEDGVHDEHEAVETCSTASVVSMDAVSAVATPTEVHSLIFTSGSTGMPKGVLTPAWQWLHDSTPAEFQVPNVVLSWLPSAWGTDRGITWGTFLTGGAVAFPNEGWEGSAGAASLVIDLAKVVRPSAFTAPPTFWVSIFHSFADDDGQVPGSVTAESRALLGDRLRMIATGGAPIADEVVEFISSFFRLRLRTAYGASEVAGIATDGVVNPDTQVKLVDIPDMGYLTTDSPPRGEICVLTKYAVARQYLGASEEANAAFDEEGWYHTGDVGVMRAGSRLEIIDRCKSFFKLSNGQFVSPAKVEGVLGQSVLVKSIIVCRAGPGSEFCGAIVVAADCDWRADEREAAILADFRRLAAEHLLADHEVPKIVILDEIWSETNGMLTPSLKPRRLAIQRKHQSALSSASAAPARTPLSGAVDSATDVDAPSVPATASALSREQVLRKRRLLARVARVCGHSAIDMLDLSKSVTENGASSISVVPLQLCVKEITTSWNPSAHDLLYMPLNMLGDRLVGSTVADSGRSSTTSAKLSSTGAEPGGTSAPISGDGATSVVPVDDSTGDRVPSGVAAKDGSPTTLSGWLEHVGSRVEQLVHDVASESERRKPRAAVEATSMETVLVTGATGFVGSFVVSQLLQTTTWPVVCLARGRDDDHARARVVSALTCHSGWHPSFSPRLTVLASDSADPDGWLGLGRDKFCSVAASLRLIFHLASTVSFTAALDEQVPVNVGGSLSVLKMAAFAPTPPVVVHVSTLSVFGDKGDQEGTITELTPIGASPADSGVGESDPYAQSKWLAEHAVFAAQDRLGIPVIVVRPGFVSFAIQSARPISNKRDWLSRYVLGSMLACALPDTACHGFVNCTPVDECARCLLEIGQRAADIVAAGSVATLPRALHIANNNTQGLRSGDVGFFQLNAYVLSHATLRGRKQPTLMPLDTWCDRVKDDGPSNPAFAIVPFLEGGLSHGARYTTTELQTFLGKTADWHGIFPTTAFTCLSTDTVAAWCDWLLESEE